MSTFRRRLMRMGSMGDLTDLGTLDTSGLLGSASQGVDLTVTDPTADPTLNLASGVSDPSSSGITAADVQNYANIGLSLAQGTLSLVQQATMPQRAPAPPGYGYNAAGQLVPLNQIVQAPSSMGGLGMLALFGIGFIVLMNLSGGSRTTVIR
jgi:hypothetical protein